MAPCDFITCQGCTDECACNYEDEATIENGTCDYDSCDALNGCTIPQACNYDPCANTNDGSCDFFSCIVFGCNNPSACNFDPEATFNDGSCDFVSCIPHGCTIEEACNYDAEAQLDNGTCEFTSCAGCTDECAPNYDATATIDNGSCEAVLGCTNALACNYDPCADTNDGSCDFLSCQTVGCMDVTACNYDEEATFPMGHGYRFVTITQKTHCELCGNLDGHDGRRRWSVHENVILGCTRPRCRQLHADATEDDGSCELRRGWLHRTRWLATSRQAPPWTTVLVSTSLVRDVRGLALATTIASGSSPTTMLVSLPRAVLRLRRQLHVGRRRRRRWCDQLEIVGCQDEAACNYNRGCDRCRVLQLSHCQFRLRRQLIASHVHFVPSECRRRRLQRAKRGGGCGGSHVLALRPCL